MNEVALLETLALIVVVALCAASPRRRGLKLIVDVTVLALCFTGALLNYVYVFSSPTDKRILPFFIVERSGGHGVVYPDFGQIFAALLFVHFLARRMRDSRGLQASERLLASETPSHAEAAGTKEGSQP